MAELLGLGDSKWAVQTIAIAAVLLLSVINVAGVKWVIKLQFILLLILLLAGLDFMVGSFVHTDTGKKNFSNRSEAFIALIFLRHNERITSNFINY